MNMENRPSPPVQTCALCQEKYMLFDGDPPHRCIRPNAVACVKCLQYTFDLKEHKCRAGFGFKSAMWNGRGVEVGQKFAHYKGEIYEVVDIITWSSDDENDGKKVIVYRGEGCSAAYGTPISRFLGEFKTVRFEKLEG